MAGCRLWCRASTDPRADAKSLFDLVKSQRRVGSSSRTVVMQKLRDWHVEITQYRKRPGFETPLTTISVHFPEQKCFLIHNDQMVASQQGFLSIILQKFKLEVSHKLIIKVSHCNIFVKQCFNLSPFVAFRGKCVGWVISNYVLVMISHPGGKIHHVKECARGPAR